MMKHYQPLKKTMLAILLAMFSVYGFAQTQWNYISPTPGSKYINPENNIAFRQGEPLDIGSIRGESITVVSEKKGEIQGEFILSRDKRTLIFRPDNEFTLNDHISVTLEKGIKTSSGLTLDGVEFSFQTMPVDNSETVSEFYKKMFTDEIAKMKNKGTDEKQPVPEPNMTRGAQALPDDFPLPVVTELDNPTPGYVFNTTFGFGGSTGYNMILDKYGTPVYYRQYPYYAIDLKMITGNRLAVGVGPFNPDPVNKYVIMNSHFEPTDTLLMGNGYYLDNHELLVLEDGSHFLFAYDPQPVGMDTVVEGGNPNATVVGCVIQKLDSDDNVVFQWRSWDHFEITDATDDIDLTSANIDYAHINAMELDTNGNLMFSLRNMDEITKIDLNTGDIIWRLGLNAKNNMFTFTNDTIGFSHQHDIRRLDNGHITVFDNGNLHSPPFSQSVEYELDEVNHTATLAWNYNQDHEVFAFATGSSRRLENGNTLIGWGINLNPAFTEVTSSKEKTWELEFAGMGFNYRCLKLDWQTDLFETSVDTIDYGEYDDYGALPSIFTITNNADYDIQITSTHNFWDSYYVSTPLPLTVPANGTANMMVTFFPTQQGHIDDVLTLNYDAMFLDTLPQRISKQIFLTGFVQDAIPPSATLTPANGTTDVDRGSIITINFDETIVYPDGSTIKTSDLKDLLVFKENDANGNDVAYHTYLDAWKKKITIIPDDSLASGMQYYVALPGSTVADREGNLLEDDVTTTFTTIDDVAPTAVINPADSTTGAFINQMITFTFNEPMQTIVGSELTDEDIQAFFNLKLNDENGEDVPFIGVINDDKTLVTIHPVQNLQTYHYYYVELVADALMDMAGNEITEAIYSHFETGEDVGIDEVTNSKITVSPNPTSGNTVVNFDNEGSKLLEVFDLNGRRIIETSTSQNQVSIDLGSQPNGFYLLKITFEDHSTGFEKLIKK